MHLRYEKIKWALPSLNKHLLMAELKQRMSWGSTERRGRDRAHRPDGRRELAGRLGALGRLALLLARSSDVSFWTGGRSTSKFEKEKRTKQVNM